MLVADARQAIKEEAPLDRLRSLTDRAAAGLPRPRRQPAAGPTAGAGREPPASGPRRRRTTTTSSTPTSPSAECRPCRTDAAPAPDTGPDATTTPTRRIRARGRRSRAAPDGAGAAGRRPRSSGPSRAGGPLAAGAGRPRQPAQALDRELDREREAERARAAGASGCPCSTTSTGRSNTRDGRARVDRRGRPGGARPGRGTCSTRLGFPPIDDVGVPFDPARHEAVSVVTDDRSGAPGTVVARAAARLRRRRAAAAAGRWSSVATQGGLMAVAPRLLRGARGRRATPRRRDPARVPQAGPHVPPGRQQGPGARRTGSRRSPRPTTSCRDPRPGARYDAFGARLPPGARGRRPGHVGAGPGRGRCRPAPGGPRRSRRRGVRRAASAATTADVDLEDLLGGMFGGGRAGAGLGDRSPGADQEAELELTVEEAYRGGRRTITLPGPTVTRQLRGQRSRRASPTGSASGWPGRAARARGGGRAGDLYLVVRIAPHPRYRLEGRDIYVDLPLAPWEAALGATVAVDTPGRRGQGEGAGRARRAGGGCGCAGRGHAEPARRSRATCTPRSRSWCRAALSDEERAPVRGAGRGRRPSTRGGSDDAPYAAAVRGPTPARASDDVRPRCRPASRPGPPARRPRPARRRARTRPASCWFPPGPARRRGPRSSGCAPASRSTTPPSGSSLRPARPHRRARGRPARPVPDLATEERADGPEPADPEVPGGAARRADQGAALRPHRGRRRAPAARAARPARGPGAPAAAAGRRRPRPAREPTLEAELDRRPAGQRPGRRARARSSSPSGWPGCSTRAEQRGQAAQGRVRLGRAPRSSPCSTRARRPRPAGCCTSRG